MVTFYQYAKQYIEEDSAFGDLARDMRDDKSFPKESCYYDVILAHLECHNACDECIETFNQAYEAYLQMLNTH